MNFEVGKLYITENNEHTDGCVFEYVGCGENVSILKFNIIKTNAYFQCKDFRIERRNVETFGFKPLFATIDDVFECNENNQEGITVQEKVNALEKYCGKLGCGNCMFDGKCNDWYDYDDDGNQTLREYGINADYEKLVSKQCDEKVVEKVNHPAHYNQGIEAIEYIESHNMDFNEGNVIKYLTRAKYKGTYLEDLKKARWYLDRLIEKGLSND